MDFESAYQRYKDGVASDEEKDFVEKELEKARKMTEIIDAYESKKAISEEYDEEKIRKAKKQYAKKNTLKILLISTLVLIVSAVIVLSAVSYPMVASVPQRSLSMVPGIPMMGTLYSCAKSLAPVNVPSPPMAMSASIPSFCMFSYACLRPSGVLNSMQRAVLMIVPPRCTMPLTSWVVNSLISSSMSPL